MAGRTALPRASRNATVSRWFDTASPAIRAPGTVCVIRRSAAQAADHQPSGSCSTHPGRGVSIAIGARPSATASPVRVHATAFADWVELSRPMTRSPVIARPP